MTPSRLLAAACLSIVLAAPSVQAQGYKPQDPGYDRPNQQQGFGQQGDDRQRGYEQPGRRSDQGFTFQGDQIPPSHDQRHYGRYDDRYSQTYQQQQAEPPRPGGGCLRYGAVGAVGGHFAGGHGVLGALAGCVAGRVVRNRDRARIDQESGRQ